MNTWREEKKINRPLLYATGGLVLGETMALFLTADQGFFWLAAMLAVLCCALSGSFRRGGAGGGGGTPALFLHGKAGPWLRYGLTAAGCILLGFGRMKLEIRERILEEQTAAERGEESLIIAAQVEEIGETDYGYRLMVSGCEEYGPEASRIPRRMYCYTDRADGLKIGMRIRNGIQAASITGPSAGRRGSAGSSGQTGQRRLAPDTAGSGRGSVRYGSVWKDVWTSWLPIQMEGS